MSRSARAAVGENAACSLWSGCGQRSVPGIVGTGRAAIAVGALQQVAPRERARQVACRQRAEVDRLPVPQTQSAHLCGELSLPAGQCLPPYPHTRGKGWRWRMLLLVAGEDDRGPFSSILTF